MRQPPKAVILGLSGCRLSGDERRLFAEANPLGFILFARNCGTPDQVRDLVTELRAAVGRADAPVLIDQEGGRVQRLRPPHWRSAPPAAVLCDLACSDEDAGVEATWLNARLIAAELADLGIDVDCAPVLDVPQPGAHEVIGDRAVGMTAEQTSRLGRVWCEGLLAGGVLPVIKHIPGHGRATADSHVSLPTVKADREELESIDFKPFRALRDMPWAMTAHVVYTALDRRAPASTSPTVIQQIIREAIGFDGVLISDDLCMGALTSSPGERTEAVLAAGCDLALHCNGDIAEMEEVVARCPPVTDLGMARIRRGEAMRQHRPVDQRAAIGRLAELLGKWE